MSHNTLACGCLEKPPVGGISGSWDPLAIPTFLSVLGRSPPARGAVPASSYVGATVLHPRSQRPGTLYPSHLYPHQRNFPDLPVSGTQARCMLQLPGKLKGKPRCLQTFAQRHAVRVPSALRARLVCFPENSKVWPGVRSLLPIPLPLTTGITVCRLTDTVLVDVQERSPETLLHDCACWLGRFVFLERNKYRLFPASDS